MSKVKLAGLDIAISDLGKTVRIAKEDCLDKTNKNTNIRIDIMDKDGNIVNGMSNENLIRGLIICSNYYLSDSIVSDEIKKYRSQLEKWVRDGVVANIDKLNSKLIRIALCIDGKNKYNYYGNTLMEAIAVTEELKIKHLI